MEKNYFFKRCMLLTVALMLVFAGSCKKGNKDPEPTPAVPVGRQVTLDKTSALPGDVIAITSNTTLEKESYEITIGTRKIAAGKYDDKTAYFVMPYLAPGSQTVDLAGMGVTEKKSITVSTYTPLANADVEINKFKASLDTTITKATASGNTQYKETATAIQKAFNEEYAKLTEGEKKEVAFMYARIIANANEAKLKANAAGGLNVNALKTMDEGDNIFTQAKVYATHIAFAISTMGAAVIAYYAPEASVSKVLALVATGASLGFLATAEAEGERLMDMIASHFSFKLFGSKQSGQGAGQLQVNALAVNAANSEFKFTPKLPAVTFKVTSQYSSISLADKGKENAATKGVFDSADKLKAGYDLLAKTVEKIKSIIFFIPSMPAFKYPIPATARKIIDQNTDVSFLSIENVSNPKIKLTLSGQGENITIRATTTEALTGEVDFTFDLVYKNPKLNTTRKTVTAAYDTNVIFGKIAVVAGSDYQIADAGKKLPKPLKVKLTDIDGKAVAGHKVQWKILTTGGSLSAAESVTDTAGVAQTEFTIGDGEAQMVEAKSYKADGTTLISGAPLIINAGVPSIYGNWEGYYFLQDGQELFSNTNFKRPGSEAYYTSYKISITNGLAFTMSATYQWYDDRTGQTHNESESESGTVAWNKTAQKLEFRTAGGTIKLDVTTLNATEMHLFVPAVNKIDNWKMESLTDDGEVLKLKRKTN